MRLSRARAVWLVAPLVALTAIAAGVSYGAKTSTESTTVPLPGDFDLHSATAKCAQGSKATGGGIQVANALAADRSRLIYPEGKREWTAVGARFDLGESELTAHVRCLKGAKVTTVSETETLPDDDDIHAVTAKCPNGAKVTGGGGRAEDPDGQPLFGFYPQGKREWTVVGLGRPDTPELTAVARCLKGARVTTRSATAALPGDVNLGSATAKCPKRTKAIGGGVEFADPPVDHVPQSYPEGKRKWTVAGIRDLSGESELTAHVLCLKKPKK